MAVLEHIRNSIPYKLYANVSPEGSLWNGDSGKDGILLTLELLNLKKKIIFSQKIYKKPLDISGHFRTYKK